MDLAVACGRPLLLRQPFPPDAFDEVILGCVNVMADEMNPARVAALRLGMGEEMTAFTVQINCGSGMLSIDVGYQSIRDGRSDLVLAGGAEALSHTPLMFRRSAVDWYARLAGARSLWSRIAAVCGFRPSFLKPVIGLERGLTDPVVELNMGQTAEILAHLFGVTRLDADHYAGNWPQVAVPFLRIRSSDTGWVDYNRVSCASVQECHPSDGWLEVLRARLRGHRPKRDQERSEIERSERRHRSAQARTPEGKPGKNRERDHD